MDVTTLCPLPVGVLFWRAPDRAMTAVVKATYALDRDGAARLADDPEPLSLDRPGPTPDADELEQASDFAPHKPRADVILVGRAWSASPTTRIDARVAVDAYDKRFVAIAAVPGASIPLVARHLRARDGRLERVGPLAPWSLDRADLARGGGIGPDGLPLPPAAFAYYNVAPPDQQLDALSETASITLEGLLRGAERRRVQLPGARPRVFSARRSGATVDVPLRCDTLWIDTNRSICTLTWRGVVIVARPEDEPVHLFVALERPGAPATWEVVRAQLDRARRTRAVEPFAPGPEEEEPLTPRAPAGAFHDDAPEPPTPRPAAISSAQPPRPRVDLTGTLRAEPDAPVADRALPFRRPPAADLTRTIQHEPAGEPRAALPFLPPGAAPAPGITIGAALTAEVPPKPTIGALATRAADEAPARSPRALAPPLLSPERYARIKAEIWEGSRALDEVLERHGMSEAEWRAHERRQAEAVAREAAEGRHDLARALREALRSARQERSAAPSETVPPPAGG